MDPKGYFLPIRTYSHLFAPIHFYPRPFPPPPAVNDVPNMKTYSMKFLNWQYTEVHEQR